MKENERERIRRLGDVRKKGESEKRRKGKEKRERGKDERKGFRK